MITHYTQRVLLHFSLFWDLTAYDYGADSFHCMKTSLQGIWFKPRARRCLVWSIIRLSEEAPEMLILITGRPNINSVNCLLEGKLLVLRKEYSLLIIFISPRTVLFRDFFAGTESFPSPLLSFKIEQISCLHPLARCLPHESCYVCPRAAERSSLLHLFSAKHNTLPL